MARASLRKEVKKKQLRLHEFASADHTYQSIVASNLDK
jgi:hypothetical protein